jgi:hypothetical protein
MAKDTRRSGSGERGRPRREGASSARPIRTSRMTDGAARQAGDAVESEASARERARPGRRVGPPPAAGRPSPAGG